MPSLVGRHYHRESYNCAHAVASWYRDNMSVNFPTDNTFSRGFALWIRRNFEPITTPEQGCLVVAKNNDGSLHVGVYDKFSVLHNNIGKGGHGAVCRWPLGTMRRCYKSITLGRYIGDKN